MNGFLNSHPSTVAEARELVNCLPGGIASLTLPAAQSKAATLAMPPPSGTLTLPPPPGTLTLPPPPQPQAQQSQGPADDAESTTANPEGADPTATKSANVPAAGMTVGHGNNGTLAGSEVIPTIINIVASVKVECRLDLKTIALHARNAEYNPKRFSAVIMRIKDPKATALIFASGKMVVMGSKSENDSRLAARKFTRVLQKLGYNARFSDYKMHNMVGTCDVGFPIQLVKLQLHHHNFSSYEPELFPGLIYKMIRPKVTFMIFASGKIVLTGAKNREEIYEAFEMMHPILKDFRKFDFGSSGENKRG